MSTHWDRAMNDWQDDGDFMKIVYDAMAAGEITLQDAVMITEMTDNLIF